MSTLGNDLPREGDKRVRLRVGQRQVGPDGGDDLGRHMQEGLQDRTVSRYKIVAVILNARGQQDQVAFRGGQTAFLEYAFQAEIALKQDGRISNVSDLFGMNLYDFRIFS